MVQFFFLVMFLLLSYFIGCMGRKRKIGFGWAFWLSMIFTPVVGFLITFLSTKKVYFVNMDQGDFGVSDESKLREKIRKHNAKVDYNRSLSSWIGDIIACVIFFPTIILVIYRRGRYNKYMDEF